MEAKPVETRTRSGRLVKKPVLYVPVEVPVDDFSDSDYDEEESEVSTEVSEDSEDEESETEGSLKDFIVEDDSEEED
jgi:hypothetical protein